MFEPKIIFKRKSKKNDITYRKPTGIKYKRVLSPSPSGQPWTFPSGVTSRKYLGPVSLPRHSNLVLTPFSCGSENKNFILGNHLYRPIFTIFERFSDRTLSSIKTTCQWNFSHGHFVRDFYPTQILNKGLNENRKNEVLHGIQIKLS